MLSLSSWSLNFTIIKPNIIILKSFFKFIVVLTWTEKKLINLILILKNLNSVKTIKYSKALYIKLQLKAKIKIPKKLVITIIIIKNFNAKQKSKNVKV